MDLKHLKVQMLLPEREYIINQTRNIQGKKIHILSFTVEKDKNSLWTISEKKAFNQDEFRSGEDDGFKSNREELLSNIQIGNSDRNIFLKEMEIQGQTIEFGLSTSSHIYDMNREGVMRLQHFVEKALIPEEWDHVILEDLVISQHQQIEGQAPPSIDKNKELDISLNIAPNSIEIPIGYSFKLALGKYDKGKKFIYYDEELEKEKYFFVNEIYSFNPYEELEKQVEDIEDEEIRENTRGMLKEALEILCPKDKYLAVIKYETGDDTQLSFNMKEYLDSKPIVCNSAAGILWGSGGGEVGPNGYKLQECVLKPVDRDFTGELELELLSRIMKIPGEKIKI